MGLHTVTADWTSEQTVASVVGTATVSNVTDHKELFLKETQIETSAQWNGNAFMQESGTLDTGKAVGVYIPTMSSTVILMCLQKVMCV